MKVYLKFFLIIYLKSFFYVMLVMASLGFIMNLLSELDFFKDLDVKTSFPLSLSLLNTPDLIYEMFPFIFLDETPINVGSFSEFPNISLWSFIFVFFKKKNGIKFIKQN